MIDKMNPLYFKGVRPIPVIPTVYTDALSYGEQLGIIGHKVDECVDKVNEVVDDNNTFKTDLTEQQNEFENDIQEQQTNFEGTMQEQYDGFLEAYQRQFGVVQTTGGSITDVMSQKAVSDILDTVVYKPNNSFGEAGQVLESTGNSIKWSDIGAPTDEQVQIAVSNWLDEHPEATTTVEDYSLTFNKFAHGVVPYGTPEMYGAVGDGVTDDGDAIRQCVANHNIVVMNGTYLVGYDPDDIISDSDGNLYAPFITLRSNMLLIVNGKLIVKHNDLQGYRLIYASNAENIQVIGGEYEGDKLNHTASNSEYSHCFCLYGVKNTKIENCYIHHFDGDGVCLGYGDYNTENTIVTNCIMDENGRNNVSVVSGINVRISDCILKNPNKYNPKANIDCEPNDNDHDIVECYISNVTCLGGQNSLTTALYNTAHTSMVFVDGIVSDRPMNLFIADGSHKVDIKNYVYNPRVFDTSTRYMIWARCNQTSRLKVEGTLYTPETSANNAWGILQLSNTLCNSEFNLKIYGKQGYAYDIMPADNSWTLENNVFNLDSYVPYVGFTAAVQSDGFEKNINFHNKTHLTTNFTFTPNGGYFYTDEPFTIYPAGVNDLTKVKKGYTIIVDNQRSEDITLYGKTLLAKSVTKLQSFADESISIIYQYEY